MGSLMGGWDSPTSCSEKGGFERNKSLTNEEIETFWKIKRKVREEHLRAVTQAQAQGHTTSDIESPTDNNFKVAHRKLAANRPVGLDISRSFPGCNTTTFAADSQFSNDDALHNLRNAKAWWTRSNWAFLNEPPLMAMEDPAYKYATQHMHVSATDHKAKLSLEKGVAIKSIDINSIYVLDKIQKY